MRKLLLAAVGVSLLAPSAMADDIGRFNTDTDFYLGHFDMKPDHDDVQAAAALGSLLEHPDFNAMRTSNRLMVYGAIGSQSGTQINPTELFDIAFGTNRSFHWTNALSSRSASLGRAFRRSKAAIRGGGKVWIQEAGQSDFTRDLLSRLRNDTTSGNLSNTRIKNNVMVVQHSEYNEDMTSGNDLRDTRNWATYVAVDDGNERWGVGPNRGPNTPKYKDERTSLLRDAERQSTSPNTFRIWRASKSVIEDNPARNGSFNNPTIRDGGVDFSDCVENFYIFQLGSRADSTSDFWNKFVTR